MLNSKLTAKEKKVVKRAAAQYHRISRHELPKPIADHPDAILMKLTPNYGTDEVHMKKYHHLADEVYRLVGREGKPTQGKMGQGHARKRYKPAIPKALGDDQRKLIVTMYENGSTVSAIKEAIECGGESIYLVLREAGITLRIPKGGPWSKK